MLTDNSEKEATDTAAVDEIEKENATEDKPAPAARRGPGRPRKKPAKTEEKEAAVPAVAETQKAAEEPAEAPEKPETPTRTSRPRGRPRKKEQVAKKPEATPETEKPQVTAASEAVVEPTTSLQHAPEPEAAPEKTEPRESISTPQTALETHTEEESSTREDTEPEIPAIPAIPSTKETAQQKTEPRKDRRDRSQFKDRNRGKPWDNRRVKLDLNNPRTPADNGNTQTAANPPKAKPLSTSNIKALTDVIRAQLEIEDFRKGQTDSPAYPMAKRNVAEACREILTELGEEVPQTSPQPAPAEEAPKESADTLMTRVRTRLGEDIETVQYIEFNLGLLLMYNEVEKRILDLKAKNIPITNRRLAAINKSAKEIQDSVSTLTFGSLISTVSEADIISPRDLDELKSILTTRNYLVHQFFKKESFEEQRNNSIFLEQKSNYLSKFHNRCTNFNDMMTKRMSEMYSRINGYLTQIEGEK